MGEKKKKDPLSMNHKIFKLSVNSKFRRTKVSANRREAAWFPGSQSPKHLDGTLPGDFGFDPLNLGKDPQALIWYRQAELQHARWAMLAVAGILVQAMVKPDIGFMDAGKFIAENSTIPYGTLLVIQLYLMSWVEGRRWQDIRKPGSTVEPSGNFFGFESALSGSDDLGYPGGAFDPMGLSTHASGASNNSQLEELKLKEIKNGRLAMLAYVGFSCAYVSTGKGPIEALVYHLSDPGTHSVMYNSYAVPFL